MTPRNLVAQPSDRESGQILILTAFTLVVLLGIAALSLDASFMYDKRNQLHAAADAAAKSAAIEVIRNTAVTQANLEAFADQQVAALGFAPSRQGGTTSVVVNRPPASGPFAGNTHYVEAIVSEPTSTFFARVLGWTAMTPGATAVAGAGNPSACLIVIEDLRIHQSDISLNGCGASVGRNLYGDNPNSRMTGTPTPPVGVTGTCVGVCGAMGDLTTGVPLVTDPLAGLALPTDPGGCSPGVAAVLAPGCYSSIETTVTTLSGPGLYYVTGPVNIGNNGSLTGTNVLLFLTATGSMNVLNNSELHLTAQTSGPYEGIALFQDPATANDWIVNNAFLLDVAGTIYMPGTDVEFRNHLEVINTGCTLFIAKSLSINAGDGIFTTGSCAALYGGGAFLTVSIAQ